MATIIQNGRHITANLNEYILRDSYEVTDGNYYHSLDKVAELERQIADLREHIEDIEMRLVQDVGRLF